MSRTFHCETKFSFNSTNKLPTTTASTLNLRYRVSLKRAWKLLALVTGFVLPSSRGLCEALEDYAAREYYRAISGKVKKNALYAYNRLSHSRARGERKMLPLQEEYKYLKVAFALDSIEI